MSSSRSTWSWRSRSPLFLLFDLLLLLAIVERTAATLASSSATVIQTSFYSGSTCSGTPTKTLQTVAGTCTPNGDNTFIAQYCAEDGLSYYQITFSNSSCSASVATQVTELATGCGVFEADAGVVCLNPSLGPFSPLGEVFPPAEWMLQTIYNPINSSVTLDCTTSTGTVSQRQATRLGNCQYRGGGGTPGVTTAQYCSGDGALSGTVNFLDWDCKAVASATLNPTGCVQGIQTTCPAPSADTVFPILPIAGYFSFEDPTCVPAPTTVTTLLSACCIDSQLLECDAAGNATYITYNDPTNTGECNATEVSYNVTQSGDGLTSSCVAGIIYTCNYTQPVGYTPPPSTVETNTTSTQQSSTGGDSIQGGGTTTTTPSSSSLDSAAPPKFLAWTMQVFAAALALLALHLH